MTNAETLERVFRQARTLAREGRDVQALARLDELEREPAPITLDEHLDLLRRVVDVAVSAGKPSK